MRAPHHHRWHATAATTIVTIVACSLNRPAAGHADNRQVSPVRSGDTSITQLIAQAVERSPTFKRLVAGIEASDGIIYVEAGVCPERFVACLPFWMVSTGRHRFMRIVVDRRRLDSDRRMAGAIAHELQHATEVLDDRFVTTGTKMHFFYRRYAPTGTTRFETEAAIHAGIAVENEWRSGDVSSSSGKDRRR